MFVFLQETWWIILFTWSWALSPTTTNMDRCPCLTPVSINVRILLSNSLRTIFGKKFLFLQQTVTMFKSQTCMSCSIIEAAINYYQQAIDKPCLTTLKLAILNLHSSWLLSPDSWLLLRAPAPFPSWFCSLYFKNWKRKCPFQPMKHPKLKLNGPQPTPF